MTDERRHRGAHPQDRELFASACMAALRTATAELAWLLTRGYATPSSLKLVCDRHELCGRQRSAVLRSVATDARVVGRRAAELGTAQLAGETLAVDGHNVLTTLETALGGGVVLVGRDGCARDIAGMHGSYRRVAETLPIIEATGRATERWQVAGLHWYLDAPVSNSGRLAALLREVATEHGWPWQVEVVRDPDPLLVAATDIVASADGEVIDRAARWCSLARHIIEAEIPEAWVVDLSGL